MRSRSVAFRAEGGAKNTIAPGTRKRSACSGEDTRTRLPCSSYQRAMASELRASSGVGPITSPQRVSSAKSTRWNMPEQSLKGWLR